LESEGKVTVKELIELLQELPPDCQVILSEDAEGNGFSPLEGWNGGIYTPDSTWSGEYHVYADDEGTTDIPREEWNAICLWPVN
jgi:hypothetical protein